MAAHSSKLLTRRNVEAKALAHNAAVLAIRPIVKQIKALPGVSASQLLTLRIEPREDAARRCKCAASRMQRSLVR